MDEYMFEMAERLASAQVASSLAAIQADNRKNSIPPEWDGLCTACGSEVPAARVLATGSSLCLECKERDEKQAKTRGR